MMATANRETPFPSRAVKRLRFDFDPIDDPAYYHIIGVFEDAINAILFVRSRWVLQIGFDGS
jgi:hypothetical protein